MLLDTTKYDGSLHYRFMTTPVYDDGNILAVYRATDENIVSYRGNFQAESHLLNIFYARRYHNIAIMWHQDWSARMHYVNIATPALWDGKRVTAVDMDLDIIRFAGEERVILDDEDEFEHHATVMNYPQELVARCRREAAEAYTRVEAREGLFGDSVFRWRPGKKLPAEILAC